MTRSELIHALHQKYNALTLADVELSVRVILESIANSLVHDQRVEVRDFGSFSTRRRPGRAARNPRTGQPVAVPSKTVPYFKPGKALRDRVTA